MIKKEMLVAIKITQLSIQHSDFLVSKLLPSILHPCQVGIAIINILLQ